RPAVGSTRSRSRMRSFTRMAAPESCFRRTASIFRRSRARWGSRDGAPRPPAGGAMKIALVAHWDWVLYHFRLPLADRLRSRGAEVRFVCPYGEYVDGLRRAGFTWLPWAVKRRGTNLRAETAAVTRLTILYRRERFGAVHHFTIKPVLYGSLAAAAAGVP